MLASLGKKILFHHILAFRQDNRTRIVVEHTLGWLNKYRRIIMRYMATFIPSGVFISLPPLIS
jgi:hypothetical protein